MTPSRIRSRWAALWLMVSAMLLCFAALPASAGDYADQKVVYHNNGGADNAKYFKGLLRNLANHVKAVGADHIVLRVVDHSDGITLLQMANSDQELAAKIDALRAEGVVFLVCKNTLAERKIDWQTLYGVKEADLVPSGVAELAKLQLSGFAYIHP